MRNRPPTSYAPPRPVYRYTQQFLQEARQLHRATWGPRFVAVLIDFVLVSVPFQVLFWLINLLESFFFKGGGDGDASPGAAFSISPLVENFLWLAALTAYAVLVTERQGATIGKQRLNLKLMRDDYAAPTRRDLLIRYSLPYISNLPIVLTILVGLPYFLLILLWLAGLGGYGFLLYRRRAALGQEPFNLPYFLPLLVAAALGLVVSLNNVLLVSALLIALDFGYSLRDPQGKTLHDLLAQTQVIVADPTRI